MATLCLLSSFSVGSLVYSTKRIVSRPLNRYTAALNFRKVKLWTFYERLILYVLFTYKLTGVDLAGVHVLIVLKICRYMTDTFPYRDRLHKL